MTIYYIRNKQNGKNYVGQTIQKINQRWNDHRSKLRNDNHSNLYLQNAWNKYGEENFNFGILESEIATLEELNRLEEAWVVALQSMHYEEGYNLRPPGNNSSFTEDTKKQVRGENSSNSKLTKEQALDIKYSPRTSAEMAEKYNISQSTTYHIRKGNIWAHLIDPEKEEKLPEIKEQREANYKEQLLNSKNLKTVLHIPSGEVYHSQREAARQVGCGQCTVSRHVNGKAKNPRFKYYEE